MFLKKLNAFEHTPSCQLLSRHVSCISIMNSFHNSIRSQSHNRSLCLDTSFEFKNQFLALPPNLGLQSIQLGFHPSSSRPQNHWHDQMKLKINKACDLSSISVLPPQSRFDLTITTRFCLILLRFSKTIEIEFLF